MSIGQCIVSIVQKASMNGDAFILLIDLYQSTRRHFGLLSYSQFQAALQALCREGLICCENDRVYCIRNCQYENAVARKLFDIINDNSPSPVNLPPCLYSGGFELDSTQRRAVALALSHRLSLIIGGAGCGKSSIIESIINLNSEALHSCCICAPTGKAAQNLRNRFGVNAITIHRALSVCPGDNFLSGEELRGIGLMIIDEASMLTLEMLAGILSRVKPSCRVVLLGDPNQLQSVGAGNVLPDLVRLGIPAQHLTTTYRQADITSGLFYNVTRFAQMNTTTDLHFDESFCFREAADSQISIAISKIAWELHSAGENFQVLSPVNSRYSYSVDALNKQLQSILNPRLLSTVCYTKREVEYRSGDKVIITENDNSRSCFNGDIGTLSIYKNASNAVAGYAVDITGRERIEWNMSGGFNNIRLAYALTVHRSQGSQYDTVILPVSSSLSFMMHRGILYTAISRAKKRVVLVGEKDGISLALRQKPPMRQSMLVEKVILLVG